MKLLFRWETSVGFTALSNAHRLSPTVVIQESQEVALETPLESLLLTILKAWSRGNPANMNRAPRENISARVFWTPNTVLGVSIKGCRTGAQASGAQKRARA